MGMGEAVTFSSIYALLARWVPGSERARAMGVINSGIPLGTVFALLITPLIVQKYGWEWAFYSIGLIGIVWFIAWRKLASSQPTEHRNIKATELAYIQSEGKPIKLRLLLQH